MKEENLDKKENGEQKENGQDMELARELIMKYRDKIAKLQGELESIGKKNSLREEAMKLKKEPFYDDIDTVIDEVTSFAAEHGISPREAYGALYAEEKAKKIQSKSDRENKNIAALSSEGNKGGEPEEGALSEDELWAARKAGMSLADYLKYKTKG